MTNWAESDDGALIERLKEVYRSEVSRARRDVAGGMTSPRVRPTGSLGTPTIATGVLVVLAAAVIFINQRGPASGSPQASVTGPPSMTHAGASAASLRPAASPTTLGGGAGETFQVGLVEVVDRSGRVTHARTLGPFEFVPAPPKSGLPFAFNPGGKPSADVRVIWFGSTCGPKNGYTVRIDKGVHSISITADRAGPWCADLGTVGIVLEFDGPIDASRVAVSLRAT